MNRRFIEFIAAILSTLLPIPAFAADILASKNIVSYTVTLDSISPKYLLTASGKKAIVEFSVAPTNRAKFTPQAVTLFIDNSPIEVTGVDEQGTYTVELIEGTDLPRVKSYEIQIVVDNAQSALLSAYVFDFFGRLTPEDNFSGRSESRVGIAERASLDTRIEPIGVTAADIGGLEWEFTGNGSLTGGSVGDGTAAYDAGDIAGAATFNLKLISGPSMGETRSYSRNIIAPNLARMIRGAGTGIFHTQGTASAGFLGIPHILPSDVSFARITVGEGAAIGTAGGYWNDPLNDAPDFNGAPHDATVTTVPVGNCNITDGCVVQIPGVYDVIDTTDLNPPPFADGFFDWPIPMEYKSRAVGPVQFPYAGNHHQTVDAAGKCCISKAGQGPYCTNANDPTFHTGF